MADSSSPPPRSLIHLGRHLRVAVRQRLWLQVLIGMALGIVTGVDRILDMLRTVVNVTGDMVAAMTVSRWLGPGIAAPAQAAASGSRPSRTA